MAKGPQEVSSKQPVSVLRQVVAPSRAKAVDPRFDRAFGDYHEDQFKAAYGFVREMKEDELAALETAAREEQSPQRASVLRRSLDRARSMRAAHAKQEKAQQLQRQWKREERARVASGEKRAPFFLRTSAQKQLALAAQYRELKERANGQPLNIDRLVEKRRKHKAARQHVLLPRRPSVERSQ